MIGEITHSIKAPRTTRADGMNPSGRRMRAHEREAESKIATALNKWRLAITRGMTEQNAGFIVTRLRQRDIYQPFADSVIAVLTDIALDGADFGREQVERHVFGVVKRSEGFIDIDWELANYASEQWARQYGYGLVNGITETTRRRLQAEISEWTTNNESINQLAKRLARPAGPFGEKRAKTIAVTETTRAYAAGNRSAWRESNVVKRRRWNTNVDEIVCPMCGPLHNVVVGIDDQFPGGYDDPPAHPNCRCWITPVVGEPEYDLLGDEIGGRETGLEQYGLVSTSTGHQDIESVPQYEIPQNLKSLESARRYTYGIMEKEDIDNVMWMSEQLADNCDVCVRVPEEIMESILDDGMLKNQHETQSSRGSLNNKLRENAEFNMFGIEKGSRADKYPIYGYLRTDGYPESALNQYGHVRITLKQDIKGRTSFNYDDSLLGASKNRMVPAPLKEPHDGNIGFVSGYNINRDTHLADNMKRVGVRYFEAQVHGGITLDDIERIDFLIRPSESVMKKLKDRGFRAGRFDPELGF